MYHSPARLLFLLFSICCLVLSSCTNFLSIVPRTLTPSPTAGQTRAIVWFPPTNTASPTMTPIALPTRAYRPALGEELFHDSFDRPDLWETTLSLHGQVIMEENELTLSIEASEPPVSMVSLRSESMVSDFYAEVSAHLRLCRDNDRYGMIFRATNENSTYRIVLDCNGQTRLERILFGQIAALSGWLASPDVPGGAPGEVKIGIWANGQEIRVFMNDRFQFNVRDNTFDSGSLGLFVISYNETPASVSFYDMAVYEITSASPTPTRRTISTPSSSATPNP